MRFFLASALLIASATVHAKTFNPPKKMVVAVPVANVRSERVPHDGSYQYDEHQETQIEQGEPVLVYEKEGDWFRVECPEQQEYTHHSMWQGYPGWVQASALTSDLTRVHTLRRLNEPNDVMRKKVLENASRHIGNSYVWGGRSLHNPNDTSIISGVDCSGLVNWSFRQLGWFVPRDAHEQYMKARPVESAAMKPGDLFFLAKTEKPEKVVHVGFYAGGDDLLEAPQTGEKVRRITFTDRFGKPLSKLKNGETVGDRVIYFGTFFVEGQ
jgi:cell wall-associated NlpC family hydrolase